MSTSKVIKLQQSLILRWKFGQKKDSKITSAQQRAPLNSPVLESLQADWSWIVNEALMDNRLLSFWVHLSLYELHHRGSEQDIMMSKLL